MEAKTITTTLQAKQKAIHTHTQASREAAWIMDKKKKGQRRVVNPSTCSGL